MSPGRRGLALLLVWLAAAAIAALRPDWIALWWSVGAVLGLALAADALRVMRGGPVEVERSVPPSVAVGAWNRVGLRVVNKGRSRLQLTVYDHHPVSVEVLDLPRDVALEAGAVATLEYSIYPTERGEHDFGRSEVVVHSPLRLWRRRVFCGAGESVRVYPNFRAIMKYTLLATDNRTSQLGIRKRPRRGEGLDFLQLREYRDGDSLRQIDWKVTSRLRKLISREYQDERDQQIVFLLDCGRKMHARDDELSHFDHALNAILLLAHVALRQGDAVGLLTFSGERRWLAPRKGPAHLNLLMNAVFDLQTSSRASDYLAAARDLSVRVKKRALVVLVSNLRDEEHDELSTALKLLGRRHLVLLASMQERVLGQVLEENVRDLDGALRVAATQRYLEQRRRAHRTLSRSGVLSLDVEPQALPVALVNGYLDVKSRRIL